MRPLLATSLVILIGGGILAVALTGCGKTRTITETLQPTAKGDVVSKVKVSVYPPSYEGECPGQFSFGAEITMSDSGAVIYRWESSDGTRSDPGFVWFAAPGTKTVGTSWSSAAPGSHWQRLHVMLPDDLVSDKVGFVNRCAPFTAWAIAHVSPASYGGSCPATFSLSAQISTNGPGQVLYQWEGSDGHNGPQVTLPFDRAGTQTVTLSRSLLSHGSFTERVHILAPRDTLSPAVSFTNACEGVVMQATVEGWIDCDGIYLFNGQITTNAGTVTYQWEHSDGFTSPVETLNFSAPGTQAVMSTRPTDWARLHVLTPIDVTSNEAVAQYDCWPCWYCEQPARTKTSAPQIGRRARH